MSPPLPPEIVQQGEPEQAQSVFAQQGIQPGGKNPEAGQAVQQVMAKMQELEAWAGSVKPLLDQVDPSLSVLLQPIAQAGMDLQKALAEKQQRSGVQRGSPVVAQTPPQSPATGPATPGQL